MNDGTIEVLKEKILCLKKDIEYHDRCINTQNEYLVNALVSRDKCLKLLAILEDDVYYA